MTDTLFLAEAERLAPVLPGADGPFGALRARGLAAWRATGLPTRRVEAWKYTDLRALAAGGFVTDAGERHVAALPDAVATVDGHRLVFVNGRFRPDLSDVGDLPARVALGPLGEARELGRTARLDFPMVALNTALFADGLALHVGEGVTLDRPVHLVSLSDAETPVASHPRHLVVLDDGACATLVESHVGTGPSFANTVMEIVLGAGAVLDHTKLQDEGADALHLAHCQVTLGRGATYDGFVAQLGAALARHEARIDLTGERAEARLNGAYVGDGSQTLDNTTFVTHTAPACTSRQVFKGVLGGTARGVFQGKILVEPDAQQTDGHQLNRTLLLSRGAEIDSKPELEIYADDVKCSHGATAGELEDDALFYLRSRGIPLHEARRLLVEAFLAEATALIGRADVREAIDAALARRLAALTVEA